MSLVATAFLVYLSLPAMTVSHVWGGSAEWTSLTQYMSQQDVVGYSCQVK